MMRQIVGDAMPYASAGFRERSERVLRAGRAVRSKLGGSSSDLSFAIDELIKATADDAGAIKFEPGQASQSTLTFGDALCGTLLDLQSANILLSTGVAVEHTDMPGRIVASDTVMASALVQNEALQNAALNQAAPGLGFDGPTSVSSSDLASAKAEFGRRATATLDEIVKGTGDVIRGAFAGIGKIDSTKFGNALDNIGLVGGFVVEAGRLVRRGLEKLKSAFDALLAFIGDDKLAAIKDELRKLWNAARPDQLVKDVLTTLLGFPAVRMRIDRTLDLPLASFHSFDEASLELHAVSTEHADRIRLLSGISTAVGYCAPLLGIIPGAAPWLPIVVPSAYATIAGIAFLVGRDYVGSSQILGWATGVDQIVVRIS